MTNNKLKHLHINGPTDRINFTSKQQRGPERSIPSRITNNHGSFLRNRLDTAWREAENEFLVSHNERNGVYLEFRSAPGFDLVIESLEDFRSKQIRLCNVRLEKEIIVNHESGNEEEREVTYVTVYVANEKRHFFFKKIEEYLAGHDENKKPKNADLLNGIEDLRKALLIDSFWTDDKNLIPGDNAEWCEVWLRGESLEIVQKFETFLKSKDVSYKENHIKFPERFVKLVKVSRNQLEMLTRNCDDIAEYRRAKETASFFTEMPPREQAEWVDDLLKRLIVNKSSVSICILDTGINNGHPLLNQVLHSSDCHSVNPIWGTDDHKGHGTLIAGLAAYGDLKRHLESTEPVEINHVLESVKILPRTGQNDPELWGDVTAQGISKAEIQAPLRKRIISMSITSEDARDRGRPTSWSGAVDQLACGLSDEARLIILSGGNVTDFNQISNYPDSQISDSIHDPSQSWNSLTVGAYTQLTDLTDPTLNGFVPLAQNNQLSPFSTTSLTWEDKWPIKPDVVFEGGNMAVDTNGFSTECEDMSVVSTFYKPVERLFESFRMTSASTAQAANFAAKIQTLYPEYWPETIRALMVHSAEWPDELKRQFARDSSKTEMKNVLRACGYGVPNLERALYCTTNSLTLIAEAEIQPYEIQTVSYNGSPQKVYKTKDMHLYDLPWPKGVLENLGATLVKMRITLSYFIEPGPGEVGWKNRYRYASHALRFDLNSPSESRSEFIKRINVAARDDNEGHPGTSSPSGYWTLGQVRDKGSIHSDIWEGTAADLAASNLIAIYPRIGWWRERSHLGKVESLTRYSLIVSIYTPEQEVDIYTPVAQQVGVSIPISGE